MPTKEVLITIRLQIDTDADVHVDVGSAATEETTSIVPTMEQFVLDNAPRSIAGYQLEFLSRIGELGISAELPATATPRTYLNLFPPKGYGAKRAGVLETRTGRADLYCSPAHVEGRRFAQELKNNGEAYAVQLYLKSPEAVNEALELAAVVLEER
jgi:hypothetical protein